MEFDENKEESYQEDDFVDIYSKRAIFWFSFFNFIFGGVLLIINLYNAGYKRAIPPVIAFMAVFFYGSNLAVAYSGINLKLVVDALNVASKGGQPTPDQLKAIFLLAGLNIAIGIIGALILTQYFFKKSFPDNDYYPKPVLKPILVMILLYFLLRVAM